MKSNKKSEVEQVVEFLVNEGFREIKSEEKNLPEYRDSIQSARKLVQENALKSKKIKI